MDAQASKDKTERRKKLVNIEASVPWIAWVDQLAELEGMSRGGLIDQALRKYARSAGFEVKPPRR